MTPLSALFILLIAVSLLNTFFSVRQVQYVYGMIDQVKRLHAGNGYLAMGNKKSLTGGTVILVAVDENGKVIDFRQMEGISVFSKFHIKKEYEGKAPEEIYDSLSSKRRKIALKKAMDSIALKRKSSEIQNVPAA